METIDKRVEEINQALASKGWQLREIVRSEREGKPRYLQHSYECVPITPEAGRFSSPQMAGVGDQLFHLSVITLLPDGEVRLLKGGNSYWATIPHSDFLRMLPTFTAYKRTFGVSQ